ncbi:MULTISPECIES: hypothetical protein [Streptacidiphilus]|uniref:Uncharacterized protein n=2 Tax=Streptacidiphilus TaxID=228398 RepID=A0ABV6UG27_9ACTN|nr:hypothetical protein [Streptacidiphilus jeojiense]
MHIGVIGHSDLSEITEMLVRGELWKLVTGYQTYGLVGVSPLGPGAESWFAAAVLEHGGTLEVLGAPAPSPLLRQARAVHRLAPGLDPIDALLGLVEELVAVWDGSQDGRISEAVARAEAQGIYVHRVWPEGSAHSG